MLEENIYTFLSNANVHVSKEKEMELWAKNVNFVVFLIFCKRHKACSYRQLPLIGEFSTQLKINAINIRHLR